MLTLVTIFDPISGIIRTLKVIIANLVDATHKIALINFLYEKIYKPYPPREFSAIPLPSTYNTAFCINLSLYPEYHLLKPIFKQWFELLFLVSRTVWKLLRHYGVPEKIVNTIRNSYDRLQCKVLHGGQLTDAFQVRTGVRQGCLLSPFLFLLVADWIMETSTSEGKHGIQWTAQNQLDDLGLADDLALLSYTHEQMQIKTTNIATVSASVGLNIHKGKTKVLKFKAENSNPITLDGETLEDVESFTYLESIIDEQRGSDADVKARIGKARVALLQLKNIWNSKPLPTNIKVRIFNTNVKTVLLYGAEAWRTTTTIIKKLQVFINNCLRKTLNVR
ncbi:unnamed protein product [Schistosoma curassoni]|uniref:Reverse transcriptase domain-containing protein n=1 Tax=Schistosoma curassoni TaxID=6186 RepID=A0A183K9X2_9TREM|nr:unnamed protein product [Schistosoma curassoni]